MARGSPPKTGAQLDELAEPVGQQMAELTGSGYSNVVPLRRRSAITPNRPPVEIAEPEDIAEPETLEVRPYEPEITEPWRDEYAEPEQLAEPEAVHIAEPESEIEPEAAQIAEPESVLEELAEPKAPDMAEPKPPAAEVRSLEPEIAEPIIELPAQIAEPEEEGVEISTSGFKEQAARLWNLTTYKDRHGKLRAKRVMRFVTRPPKPDIGIVTEDLAGKLDQRKGRGRWKSSRIDSGQLKAPAQLAADAYWRTRGVGKGKGSAVSDPDGAED